MVKINTNLTSLIVQSNLSKSTNRLNQAIERMTTGFKINHAKDNAANHSIVADMSTKISAYEIAEDNAATGLDMVSMASDTLDQISDRLARLRALQEQANNGTYGEDSLKAMKKEINSLIDEISRMRNSVEFNGQNLLMPELDFQNCGAKGLEVKESGFMLDIEVRDTSSMTSLASVAENVKLAQGTYSISSAEEFAKLARMQNAGMITAGSEFVLASDIDLSYTKDDGWLPISGVYNRDNRFECVFDGNGHVITNLYVKPWAAASLFGRIQNAEIKNLGIKGGAVITGDLAGGLVNSCWNSTITNCFVEDVKVESTAYGAGGLIAFAQGSTIDYCYTTGGEVTGIQSSGGLVANLKDSNLTNSFSANTLKNCGAFTGGLVANAGGGCIDNCFAAGDVISNNMKDITATGGLCGYCGSTVKNSHATGDVIIEGLSSCFSVGGLFGQLQEVSLIENCYATGNVVSNVRQTGGLIGAINYESSGTFSTSIKNCFATGNVTSSSSRIGGLIGRVYRTALEIENCYSSGNVQGNFYTGGFIGEANGGPLTVTNCYASGNVKGTTYTAGLCGYASESSTFKNSYASGTINGTASRSGGLFGSMSSLNAEECYFLGKLEGIKAVFAGYAGGTITNCFYSAGYEKDEFNLVASGSAVVENSEIYGGVVPFSFDSNDFGLQVGIHGDFNNRITVNTAFTLNGLKEIRCLGLSNPKTLSILDNMITEISSKQAVLGSIENRLESVLEEINAHYENLVSARSTLRDADVAKESSEYIRNQILQEAAATLLATANQSPSIALQLL